MLVIVDCVKAKQGSARLPKYLPSQFTYLLP